MKSDYKVVRLHARTIAQDCVSVKPMGFPSSAVFHLESTYKVKHGPKIPTLREPEPKNIKL